MVKILREDNKKGKIPIMTDKDKQIIKDKIYTNIISEMMGSSSIAHPIYMNFSMK